MNKVRSDMKKTSVFMGVLLFLSACGAGFAQAQADERLFEEAKILIFDKNWAAAQEKLDGLLEKHPGSPLTDQALFYRAKCLSEQKGREKEALKGYESFIRSAADASRSAGLVEDSEISIIDLASRLYENGEKPYLEAVKERLDHPNKVVRYYAAFKMSYIPEKGIARRAVPVLKNIIERERDVELRDRARIALLRVSPDALKSLEEARPESRARLLKLQVIANGLKTVDVSIPWALADLALQAMPEEEKAKIRKQGYDLDKILRELAKSKSSLLELKEENSVIRIWVE